MKTARKKTHLSASKPPPAGELDACILDLIARGVERRTTDAEFNALALLLFRHQFALNLPYRRYCELLDRSPRNVEHWTQIPAVPTTAFKDAELTTLQLAERVAVFHSSGTTKKMVSGQRSAVSRHFHSVATLALYEAVLWPMFIARMTGDEWREKGSSQLVILTPTPAEAPYSSLVHMMEVIRRRLGAPRSAFVGAAALEDGHALVTKLRSTLHAPRFTIPALLLGTAFAFVHLFDVVRSLPLPLGSRVMETGGYKGRTREVPREVLHAQISAKLGVPLSAIVSEYGMCELSSQFYAGGTSAFTRSTLHAPRSTTFTNPPWTRVQIIDPETEREAREGGRGLIRVFDLANRASVIAVQTEDIGVRRGDGFELIGRAPQAKARGCSLMVPA